MKSYVLDASVIVGFLLESKDANLGVVTRVLRQSKSGKAKVYSSPLLAFEVGNALRYCLRSSELAKVALAVFSKLPIEFFSFTDQHQTEILESSYRTGTTFYDSSYHFLARLLNATFLTADSQYFKKAEGLGNIKLL